MKKYSEELKNRIIARMLPPNNASVRELAEETGIPKDPLYTWRLKHRKQERNSRGINGPASKDKFAIILETASMNEHEPSAYCRKKGFYPAQIEAWKEQCQRANETESDKADRKKLR